MVNSKVLALILLSVIVIGGFAIYMLSQQPIEDTEQPTVYTRDFVSSTYKSMPDNRPNIIVMLGDGMAIDQIKLGSWIEYGSPNASIMQTNFPVQAPYYTQEVTGKTTDSAAGGSALSTGQLTKYGVVCMDPTKTQFRKTILEYLSYDFGYSTGVVTNTEVAHATPATFSAHATDRDDTTHILNIELNNTLDLVMGGGLDVAYINSEVTARNLGNKYGYDVATNKSSLISLANSSDHLLGVFTGAHMPYEVDRNPITTPSLVDMTQATLNFFDRKEQPFFVMIEGGRIDHAGHLDFNTPEKLADKTIKSAIETIMFEKSVRLAYDYAKADGNTIVIVVADHETGGLKVYDGNALNATIPTINNTRDYNMKLRKDRALAMNVSWYWTAHTNNPVMFYGYGSDFGNYSIHRNIDVFWALNAALGSFPVFLNYSYDLTKTNVHVAIDIRDLDRSTNAVRVYYQSPDYDEVQMQEFSISMVSENYSFTADISVDAIAGLNVYAIIVDNVYSTGVFSYKSHLIVQEALQHPVITLTNQPFVVLPLVKKN